MCVYVWICGQYGKTPLFNSCMQGSVEVVKALLADNRVDVNKADEVNRVFVD